MSHGENITSQVSQLSAEVEPFVPSALPLPTSDPSGGTQPHVLPRYVTSCYPFVQPPEVTPEGYVQEVRWPSSVPNPQYNPYPPLSPQPHLPHYYPPHNTPPPPGPFLPHPSPYPPPLYAGYPPPPHLYPPPYGTRSPTQQVTKQKTRRRSGSRSVQTKSIAVQKEASSNSPVHNRHRTIILLDASQQTDFPDDIADKSLRDKPSPLLRKSKARRLASRRPQDPSSTDSEEDEGGIDSDSGYSSPKHGRNQSANSSTSEAATGTCIVQQAGAPLDYAGYIPPHYYQAYGFTHQHTSHVGLTHPPPPGPMIRQDTASPRGRGRGRGAWGQPPPPLPGEAKGKWRQRKRSPKNSGGREREEHPELDGSTLPSTPRSVASSDAESLQFHDEMEFPSLGAPQQSQAQNPSAPMSYSAILQTAAPPKQLPGSQEPLNPATVVSTPVEVKKEGKNARKKRKKALLAAKAAAEEYSEITQEQSKLQEIQKKASGKKSKQPMQLDLGDMLAALEKRQQELKLKTAAGPAKTAAVSTGTVPVQVVSSDNKQWSGKKEASNVSMPHNPLDSHAPAVKRGKERETPHKKKPSALKKVILKEREDKKMQKLMEDQAHSDAETGEVPSSTACYIPFSMEDSDGGTSQEEPKAMSAPEPKEEEYYGALSQDDHSFRGSMSLSATGSELSPLSQAMSPINFSPLSSASPLSSGTGSPLCAPSPIGPKIHSRRFREYCNQVLDKEIDATVTMLLQDLVRFQDRQYHKDPIKAKAKRRIVMGLREVTKHLKLRKLKCIIIAPNLEKIQSKGGLDDAIETILNLCMEQDVPFVFALGRKALGRAVNKLVPVSVVGVFNYDGAEEHFKTMVELTTQARNAYIDMVTIYRQEWEQMQAMRNSGQPIYPAHLGHSRNPSAASAVSFSSVLSETISECHPEHDGDIEGPKIKVEAAKVTEESKLKGQEECTEQGAIKAEPTKESLNSETENNLKENSSESNSDRADVESESSEGPESVSRHSEIVEFPPAYDDVLTSSAATTVVNGAESEVTDVVEEEGDVLNTSCSSSKLRVLDTGRIESWVVEASQCVEKLDLDPQQHAEEKIDPDQKKAESKVTSEQDSSKDLRADSKPDVDTRPGRNVSPTKQMDSTPAEEQNTANCDLSNLKQNVQLQSEGGEVSAEKKTIASKDEDSTAGQTGSLSEPADEVGKFNGTVSTEINDR
ncbi:selenocysteine insertion sequence-binding protein 2-like isoform X3 [Branchiostoma floridae]|uniref:Selenocysteine insertion sequence-binding protein 2-like isoform X3 n=1 Tax=Branchiostoma floridae TaxID=7739 RepID=A0A9J7KVE8_BRAFL|nr:selenocysteine insertion sequence-binding protein 2-like isoform X3 [Branchiostoma floridae]